MQLQKMSVPYEIRMVPYQTRMILVLNEEGTVSNKSSIKILDLLVYNALVE